VPDANELYNQGLRLMASIEPALRAMTLDADARAVAGQAERLLRSALELAENHGRAHIMLGTLYRYTERPREALPHFERALGLPPESADWFKACEGLASSRMMLNYGSGALKVLRRALLHHPTESILHRKIAACLADAGDVEEAKLALQAALALDPKDAEAGRMLEEVAPPPPKEVDYVAAGQESQRLSTQLRMEIMRIMAGGGSVEEKTAQAMRLQEEFQRKIKALYGA
jgi:tetratricopeptide (TPR) repeat protein